VAQLITPAGIKSDVHAPQNCDRNAAQNSSSASPIFAHAAFTHAGGFDGDFNRLLAPSAKN
jgi:hypothetical protein